MSLTHALRAFAVVVLASIAALTTSPSGYAAPRQAASPLPADPKERGYVGLCDEAGHNVVGGSVDTHPFIWKAVASAPPPAAYQGPGQDAVLNIYQPRPDTLPSEWSGSALTGAAFYSNSTTPAVQATYGDLSLADVMGTYPPKVDGLYVLRIFWGKKNYGLYNATYPATVIQVVGKQWHVVSGGTVNCADTTATSLEQLTGVATKQDVTPRAPAAGQSTAPAGAPRPISAAPVGGISSSTSGAGVRPSSATTPGAASTPQDAAPAAETSSNPSSSHWVLWTLGGIVAALAAALILSVRRRRVAAPSTSPSTDDPKD